MAPDRIAPEPALSDVVRQRLAALLDEVPARHFLEPDDAELADPPAEPLAAANRPSRVARLAEAVPVGVAGGGRSRAAGTRGLPSEAADVGAEPELPTRLTSAVRQWPRVAWEFSRQHLVAVGVVLLTGCLWAGYNVLQARSTPVPAVAAPSVAATPSASTSPPARILVHVLGAVRKPGVVSLPEGARVQDALAAAGGLSPGADPAELNLAAVVADGAQLIIGDAKQPQGEVRGAATASGGSAPVSLNTATAAQLEELPGVGPVTAGRIVAWREQHGRFASVTELQEVEGIGPKSYAQLADLVRL